MGSSASLIVGGMGNRSSHKLSKEVVRELTEETQFTPTQIQKWHKEFIKDCPEGVMTKEVFKNIYAEFFPSEELSKFGDYVFNMFDADKDGVISFREFVTALSVTMKGTVDDKLNWAFSLYDLDSDGYVTREEMLDIVRAIYRLHDQDGHLAPSWGPPEKKVEQLFAKLDLDGDGKLSRFDFCEGFKTDPAIVKALIEGNSSSRRRPQQQRQRN